MRADRGLGGRGRIVVIKARVVRHAFGRGRLGAHLQYLRREGVARDETRGALFGAEADEVRAEDFARRCEGDRHHFRFIISPEDASELADLKAFTRDLMRQAEADLGTRLDWAAVDHWNTGQPHVHVLLRGRTDRDQDLVISRDYIGEGLRARAGRLVTLELGPRTDADLKRALDRQVGADRWTALDRALVRSAGEADGLIDLRPGDGADTQRLAKLRRLQKLERLGLAQEVRPGRWRLEPDAERTLREVGRQGDLIARIHDALQAQGLERDPTLYVFGRTVGDEPLAGRLAGRGLDDELTGRAYAILDGADGRTHHIPLADLEDATDAPLGAVVAVRRRDGDRRGRVGLSVRSDLGLEAQIKADGATWLDRQLVGRTPVALGEGGFADDVRKAMAARAEHLMGEGLARRDGRRVIFARDLLETLRDRELTTVGAKIAGQSGLTQQPLAEGGAVEGAYRQRLNLASGRFAMIDTGLGFSLVPWRPDLEAHLGRRVEGVVMPGGGVAWSLGRTRGLGR